MVAMRNDDFEPVKADVTAFLKSQSNPVEINFIFIEQRFFSYLYEVQCSSGSNRTDYVLKVSTTSRSCKNEFDQYIYLSNKGIKSLQAIHYSEEYNYLITLKEELLPLDKLLIKNRSVAERERCFFKLGRFLKDLDLKTGTPAKFREDEYKNYVIPRIEALEKLNARQKASIIGEIDNICSRIGNQAVRECFVNDFSLGNIHIDSAGNIVLVDTGDATVGNSYDNISFIFLAAKFGPLSHYFDFNENSAKYFASFLGGYEIDKVDRNLFTLFKIKHLVNMMSFISSLKTGSKNPIRKLPAIISNAYLLFRYKRYLLQTRD